MSYNNLPQLLPRKLRFCLVLALGISLCLSAVATETFIPGEVKASRKRSCLAAQQIKRSFLLSFTSLNESLEIIQSTTTKDEFHNDVEKAVAFAQLEFLTVRNVGLRTTGSAGMLSVQLDAPQEFPNLTLILRVLQLRWFEKVSHNAAYRDYQSEAGARRRMLESLGEAINLATDQEIVAVAKAFYTMQTTQDSLTAAQVNEAVETLISDPLFSKSPDMQVVAALIRSKEENLSLQDKDRFLEQASQLAHEKSLSFYRLHTLNRQLAIIPSDVDRMNRLHRNRLEANKVFGSKIDIVRNLRSIARIEGRNRDYENAMGHLIEAKNVMDISNFSEIEKSRILSDLQDAKLKVESDNGPKTKAAIHDVQKRKELSLLQRESDLTAVQELRKSFENADELEMAESKSQELQQETQELNTLLSISENAQLRYLWISIASLLTLLAGAAAYRFRVVQLALRAELAEQKASLVDEKNKVLALETKVERLKASESLGLMAGGIAHDFNNLLQGVSGNVELIRKSIEDSDSLSSNESLEQSDRVNAISDAAFRAQQLAQKMLDYAGKRHSTKTTFDLNEFISDEIALVRSTSINHQFAVETNREQLLVHGDKMQLLQVLLNFVTNAVEASAAGSEITVRVFKEFVEDGQSLDLFGSREAGGDFCVLEVKDQGTGIALEQIARIFAPYFSTKNKASRGLGLSIAYGAAETHEGWVRCRPNDGPGTTFQLLIPELPVDQHSESVPAKELLDEFDDLPTENLSGRKILIVDDQPVVLDTCQRMAESLGLIVTPAHCGNRALQILDAQVAPNAFDFILLDVAMPQMSAGELLAELEARKQQTPVFIMSGFSHQRLERFREQTLVAGIIPKPFRLKHLKRELTRNLGSAKTSPALTDKPFSRPHIEPGKSKNKTNDRHA
jgi:signal transduction histidine kinase/DNA-binding NarL/FixJ family response regulator